MRVCGVHFLTRVRYDLLLWQQRQLFLQIAIKDFRATLLWNYRNFKVGVHDFLQYFKCGTSV